MDRLQRILVPVDFSEASVGGLRLGAGIARHFGARLTVLHVEVATSVFTEALTVTNTPAEVEDAVRQHRQSMRARLQEFAAGSLDDASDAEVVVLDDIFVAEAIVRFAEDREMDLICMGGTGHRALERLVLGDTATAVLRHSHVPVLTQRSQGEDERAGPFEGFESVLVAVDLGEGSGRLVETAAALARPGGRLTLLHVVESFLERGLYGVPLEVPAESVEAVVQWCETALQELATGIELEKAFRVLVGRPAAGILGVERELQPDLTIVGTHGRHGMERLALGSVAERVARRAAGPVLVVPSHVESAASG
jgi:nucleotide-binding universal stress UspA family protein